LPDLEAGGAKPEGWEAAAKNLRKIRDLLSTHGNELGASDVLRQHQALGDLMAEAKGNARRVYADLYHKLGDEVDSVISSGEGGPAAQAIQDGWNLYKRQATGKELLGYIDKAVKSLRDQEEELIEYNASKTIQD